MPAVGTPEYETEIKKWDTPIRLGGYKPDGYQPFPKTLFKAKRENGQIVVETCIVQSAEECERQRREGWAIDSPLNAIDALNGHENDIAQAAMEAAGDARRFSAKAREEHELMEATTDGHVIDVTPKAVHAAKKGK